MSRIPSSFALCFCFALIIPPGLIAQRYKVAEIHDLPGVCSITTLGGCGIAAYGINQLGQVTGLEFQSIYFPIVNCFLYSKGTTHDLGNLPGANECWAMGINDSGQISGSAFTDHTVQAFLYSNGVFQGLGSLTPLGYSYGYGINNSGQMTGQVDTNGTGFFHAFLYSDGVINDLGTLPNGTASLGKGINNIGQITGYGDTGNVTHAFIYQGDQLVDIGTLPGGTMSQGAAINDHGQVTGFSNTANAGNHAVRYTHGKMRDLGVLHGTSESSGSALNKYGDVVGSAGDPKTGFQHAFLYTDGIMKDLNNLIPRKSGWILQGASGINDRGEIIGFGTLNGGNGVPQAFILTPDCRDRDRGQRRDDHYCHDREEQTPRN
jgi:probable HAF family extracellular repeat protein